MRSSPRRNTDEDLRALERAAATGGQPEIQRYVAARLRTGRGGEIMLAELQALTPELLAQVIAVVPEGLRATLRTALGTPAAPASPLPVMTHGEILAALSSSGHSSWATDYYRAVELEASELRDYQARIWPRRRFRVDAFMDDARRFYAETVSQFLTDPARILTPDNVFANRRTSAAWATAERLREILQPCVCGHGRSLHTGGPCRGAGATLDPEYGIPPDEACACSEFEAQS